MNKLFYNLTQAANSNDNPLLVLSNLPLVIFLKRKKIE